MNLRIYSKPTFSHGKPIKNCFINRFTDRFSELSYPSRPNILVEVKRNGKHKSHRPPDRSRGLNRSSRRNSLRPDCNCPTQRRQQRSKPNSPRHNRQQLSQHSARAPLWAAKRLRVQFWKRLMRLRLQVTCPAFLVFLFLTFFWLILKASACTCSGTPWRF